MKGLRWLCTLRRSDSINCDKIDKVYLGHSVKVMSNLNIARVKNFASNFSIEKSGGANLISKEHDLGRRFYFKIG